jgi:hypothetical protein
MQVVRPQLPNPNAYTRGQVNHHGQHTYTVQSRVLIVSDSAQQPSRASCGLARTSRRKDAYKLQWHGQLPRPASVAAMA